jgi:hypothetical protein
MKSLRFVFIRGKVGKGGVVRYTGLELRKLILRELILRKLELRELELRELILRELILRELILRELILRKLELRKLELRKRNCGRWGGSGCGGRALTSAGDERVCCSMSRP